MISFPSQWDGAIRSLEATKFRWDNAFHFFLCLSSTQNKNNNNKNNNNNSNNNNNNYNNYNHLKRQNNYKLEPFVSRGSGWNEKWAHKADENAISFSLLLFLLVEGQKKSAMREFFQHTEDPSKLWNSI